MSDRQDDRRATVPAIRLEMPTGVAERFGVDKSSWKVLAEATFPSAKTAGSIVMALAYCKARNLDVFKKPVHIVPVYNSATRSMIETVWPSIAELRTTAFRTGQFAGMEATVFGPEKTRTFKGSSPGYQNKPDENREITVTYPEWCQITVHRMLNGQKCTFVGPQVWFEETYARWKNTEVPNEMWAKRVRGQLEKCAEAAALRRAFPEEIGNDYAADEMEGQVVYRPGEQGEEQQVQQVTQQRRAAPSAAKAISHQQQIVDPIVEEKHETVTSDQPIKGTEHEAHTQRHGDDQVDDHQTEQQQTRQRRAPSASASATKPQEQAKETQQQDQVVKEPYEPEKVRTRFLSALREAQSREDLNHMWQTIILPYEEQIMDPDFAEYQQLAQDKAQEIKAASE